MQPSFNCITSSQQMMKSLARHNRKQFTKSINMKRHNVPMRRMNRKANKPKSNRLEPPN